jgi:ribonuclease D
LNGPISPEVSLNESDLSCEYSELFSDSELISVDIETSGLDWKTDRIATCQLYSANANLAVIIRIGEEQPTRLLSLITDRAVTKVFHHAMFDLRFIVNTWGGEPHNIACTKICSKLLFPNEPQKQRLQYLVKEFLDLDILKDETLSDWFVEELTESQIAYAINDVLYLQPLLSALTSQLESLDLNELARECFAFIPARVSLDLLGCGDVFVY